MPPASSPRLQTPEARPLNLAALNCRLSALESAIPPRGRPPELILDDPLTGVTVKGCPDSFTSVDAAAEYLNATQGEPASPDLVLRIQPGTTGDGGGAGVSGIQTWTRQCGFYKIGIKYRY